MTIATRLQCALIAALLIVAQTATAQLNCETPLFATDFTGKATHGSKSTLLAAVARGEPIRIGWQRDFDKDGVGGLTHWADATFLSVWKGEVFTQVQSIHTQSPQRSEANIKLRDPYVEWRGSIGTTGRLESRSSDQLPASEGRLVATMWCLANATGSKPVLLYRHGPDGEPLAGSKAALFAALREGQDIRIGWGFSRERQDTRLALEHLVSPVFITGIDGEHLTAQLPEHIAQRAYADIDRAFFDDPAIMWRGLMSTNGTFDAVWVNRATGEVLRRHPQRAALSWFGSNAPALDADTLAVPNGVQIDASRAAEKLPN